MKIFNSAEQTLTITFISPHLNRTVAANLKGNWLMLLTRNPARSINLKKNSTRPGSVFGSGLGVVY